MNTTVPSETPPIDLDALRQMLGNDSTLVEMILDKFRAEIKVDIDQLGVLETQQQPEPIRALAHRLKGTCGNTQAMTLSNLGKSLQFAAAAGDMDQASGLIAALEIERAALEHYLEQQGY